MTAAVQWSGASSRGTGKRQSTRLRLNVRARLTSARGTQLATMVDLSQTGARLELSASYALSEARLEWLDLAAEVRVAWQDNRLCGVEFDEPLPFEWVARTRTSGR